MTKAEMFREVAKMLRSGDRIKSWRALEGHVLRSEEPSEEDTRVFHELLWDLFLARVLAFQGLPGNSQLQIAHRHTDWSENLARMEQELLSEP